MAALDIAAAGVLACVNTMAPTDGLSRVPVGALKDLARALEEHSPGLLARVAGTRAEALLPALAFVGPNCAGGQCRECKAAVDARHLDGCSWQFIEEWVSGRAAQRIGDAE